MVLSVGIKVHLGTFRVNLHNVPMTLGAPQAELFFASILLLRLFVFNPVDTIHDLALESYI